MKKVNYKKLKTKKEHEKDKVFQVLKYICFIGIAIVILEFIWFGYLVLTKNKDFNIDLAQKIINLDNGYMVVGSSDFSNSEINEKLDKESGKVAIYDDKNNLVKEFKYDKNYRSVFYDAVEVSDGYIVVGAVESTEKQHKSGLKDALIVKFDKDGKVIWDKTYKELDNSYFKSLLIDNDSIIVVGSSNYESDVIGNEEKGGAIIVKYDLSGELLKTNHFASNKSGSFNDIIKIDDMYYVVGSSSSEKAILMSLDKEFNEKMKIEYEDVNKSGFTSLVYADNSIFTVCSKTKEEDKKLTEKATIVKYDLSGKKINEITYKEEDYSIWNDIIGYNNKLYLVGDSAKKEGKKNSLFVEYIYKGIISKYDYDLKQNWIDEYSYENNDYYRALIVKNDKLLVTGFTNSKNKELGSNKYNYVTLINEYNFEGQLKNK